jgi:hypothetical protein
MAAILQKRNGERARESEEKIGQHGVAMRIVAKSGGVSFVLRERSKRDLPCMLSKWHSCKRGPTLKGVHFIKGGRTL